MQRIILLQSIRQKTFFPMSYYFELLYFYSKWAICQGPSELTFLGIILFNNMVCLMWCLGQNKRIAPSLSSLDVWMIIKTIDANKHVSNIENDYLVQCAKYSSLAIIKFSYKTRVARKRCSTRCKFILGTQIGHVVGLYGSGRDLWVAITNL
jgi:hypothetical protein